MVLKKDWNYLFLIVLFIVVLDQVIKNVVLDTLVEKYIHILSGCFSLTLVQNQGAVFGILPGKRWLFILLSLAIILFIFYLYYTTRGRKILCFPLGLLLGGTIGNLIDRLRFGYVIDYIDIYWRTYHWPAFNIADLSICIGAGLLLYVILSGKDELSSKGK